MTSTYLPTGRAGELTAADVGSLQRIVDVLAGAGLESIRLDELESAAICIALDTAHGNRTLAARSLGISVRTLQRKLKAIPHLEEGVPFDGARTAAVSALKPAASE